MREILTDIAASGSTVLISSHILGELEKIATHYGIIRQGKMIVEMTAEELEKSCPTYIAIQCKDKKKAEQVLNQKYSRVNEDEQKEYLRIYDANSPQEVVKYLYDNDIVVNELRTDKISLEEYYINLMKTKEVK